MSTRSAKASAASESLPTFLGPFAEDALGPDGGVMGSSAFWVGGAASVLVWTVVALAVLRWL